MFDNYSIGTPKMRPVSINCLFPISEFLSLYRMSGRTLIPEKDLSALSGLFQRITRINLNFSKESPLSVMETLALGLQVIFPKRSDRAAVLSISESAVRWHDNNIIDKLRATHRIQAICIAISSGIITFFSFTCQK